MIFKSFTPGPEDTGLRKTIIFHFSKQYFQFLWKIKKAIKGNN